MGVGERARKITREEENDNLSTDLLLAYRCTLAGRFGKFSARSAIPNSNGLRTDN